MINFKNIANLLLALLLLSSFFSIQSCKKKKKEEKQIYGIDYHRGDTEEEVNVEAEQTGDDSTTELAEEQQEDNFADNSDDYYSDASFSVSKIRKYLKREKYKKVISTLENTDSALATYYKGIAYFNMSKNYDSSSKEERLSYLNNASELLLAAAEETDNDEVEARALMWFSILIHVSNTDKKSKQKALRYLSKIENNLSHTTSFGDSLVVQANIYRYLGKIEKAANIYYRIAKVDDEYIYDYETGHYFSPKKSSEYFLKEIWWIPRDSDGQY